MKKRNPIFDEYEAYKQLCADRKLSPCDLVAWQVHRSMLPDHHIPYVSPIGSVWGRDTRKKTGRADRPVAMFLFAGTLEKDEA